MTFQKGQEKTGGRAKGSVNRAGAQLKKILAEFVDENTTAEALGELWNTLDANGKVSMMRGIFPYLLPKMSHHEIETGEGMTREEARDIINAIIDNDEAGADN